MAAKATMSWTEKSQWSVQADYGWSGPGAVIQA